MKADRRAIGQAIDRPDPALRLLLLHGPDEAGSRALAERYAKALGNPERIDLAPSELKADPARLADEAAAIAMFGGPTLIRIDGVGDESLAAVAALLEAPVAGNSAVAIAGSLRKDNKLLALVDKAPAALSFASYPPEGRDAESAAADIARSLGLRAHRDVLRRLIDATGADRTLMTRELEKLALYLDADEQQPADLNADTLDELGAGISESDLGRLVDGALGGHGAETERQLSRLEAEGTAGILILRAVSRRLLLLAELRSAMDGGESIDAVMTSRGRAIFWKDKPAVTAQLRLWRAGAIDQAVAHIAGVERAIKSSGSAGDILAGQALLDLARVAARSRS